MTKPLEPYDWVVEWKSPTSKPTFYPGWEKPNALDDDWNVHPASITPVFIPPALESPVMTSPDAPYYDFTTYDPAYRLLLLRTHVNPAPINISLPSDSQAHALRTKLYSYFKALRTTESSPELIAVADALTLTVVLDVLTVSRKSDQWDAVALRAALGTLPTPTPNTSLQRLKDLRATSL